jgi:hypothetical protein
MATQEAAGRAERGGGAGDLEPGHEEEAEREAVRHNHHLGVRDAACPISTG